jgi:glutaredoxin/cytochrome c biogenesis protein CcdA
MIRRFGIGVWLLLGLVLFTMPLIGQGSEENVSPLVPSETATIYMFGRDECGFCRQQKTFFEQNGIEYEYLNIATDDAARALYEQVVAKHGVSKVTPITVVGPEVFVGFNSERTTGAAILEAVERSQVSDIKTIEEHLERAPVSDGSFGGGCSGISCETGGESGFSFDLPFLGVVDLKDFSLFTLSLLLGTIDGFNPCAMWVLITFLMLLSQAGSKQKMVVMAGIFVVAEAVMYNLILNAWYKTWDFVALDAIVTPLVGALAVGGGCFFLYRWRKNKSTQLVCDISDIETQMKTVGRFKAIASQPITIASILAILVIAFSVNVIEFACSIGIPQAYTKILEMNALTFMERQWYILIYTIGYMIDDFIVFGLAIWGYDKLQSHGARYAQLSLLIGGTLMLMLGLILITDPTLLVLI